MAENMMDPAIRSHAQGVMESLPNLKAIKGDILKHWLAQTTSKAISVQLGFAFNQYLRWQQGKTRFLWHDFVHLCRLKQAPLADALTRYLGYTGKLQPSRVLCHALIDGHYKYLLKRLPFSRFAMSRWSKGQSEPSFEDVCLLVSTRFQALLPLLDDLLGLENLPSCQLSYQEQVRYGSRRDLFPYLDALHSAIALERYAMKAHDPVFLAHVLGIEIGQVEAGLRELVMSEAIRWNGVRYERLDGTLNQRHRHMRTVGPQLFWLGRAQAMLAEQKMAVGASVFDVQTCYLSDQAAAQLRQLCLRLTQEALAIQLQDQGPAQHLLVVNCQLLALGDASV